MHAALEPGRKLLDLLGVVLDGVVVAAFDWYGYGTIGVEVNGVPLDLERIPNEAGFVLSGTVPRDYKSDRHFARISIRTPEPMPQHETPDPRKLGLGITEMRLRPPQQTS